MNANELLQSLSLILNAHQDIEDALDAFSHDPSSSLQNIKQANAVIGREVVKHLPE